MSQSTTFEGRSPQELQAKVRKTLGAELNELTVLRHGRQRYGGVLGFFQNERWLVEVEVPDTRQRPKTAEGQGMIMLNDAVAADVTSPLNDLLESTTDLVQVDFGQTFATVMADAEAVVASPDMAPAGAQARAVPSQAAPRRAVPGQAAPQRDRPADRARETPPARRRTPTRARPERSRDDRRPRQAPVEPDLLARARLITAGLADHLLPDTGDPRPELALLLSLLRLPPAPKEPTRPGDVILLAGPLAATVPLGQQLAQRYEEPFDLARIGELTGDLVVASARSLPDTVAESCRARTPEEAGAVVFKRRAKRKTTVVILDSAETPGFITSVVAGVRPEAMWAVVPASWSVERVEKLEELTGAFDAIALEGFLDTERPAQLLGQLWPVSYIDGWAASPLSIAARLLEAVTKLAEERCA